MVCLGINLLMTVIAAVTRARAKMSWWPAILPMLILEVAGTLYGYTEGQKLAQLARSAPTIAAGQRLFQSGMQGLLIIDMVLHTIIFGILLWMILAARKVAAQQVKAS
jgi:hypothetical protein